MPEQRHRLITLTTDFGGADGFPGVMKGVIAGIAPEARVVDLAHDVPPQDVAHASFLLGAAAPYFRDGTIHVVVVDPGVGTDRRPVVLRTPDGSLFVGPDNGVFSHVIRREATLEPAGETLAFLAPWVAELPAAFDAYEIADPGFRLPDVSVTFHGRDVFAPAAAHLAAGTPSSDPGPRVDRLTVLNLPGPGRDGDWTTGHVQYVDRFGNLVTDLPAGLFGAGASVAVRVSDREERVTVGSYAEAGRIGIVPGSHGYLEIAVARGNAALSLGEGVGSRLAVARARDT